MGQEKDDSSDPLDPHQPNHRDFCPPPLPTNLHVIPAPPSYLFVCTTPHPLYIFYLPSVCRAQGKGPLMFSKY